MLGLDSAIAQNTALFLSSQPFSPDPASSVPPPPALEGLTLPDSLTSPLTGFLATNVVRKVVAWDFDGDGDKDILLCGAGRLFLLRSGPGIAGAPLDQPWGVFSDASHLLATPATTWGGWGFLRDIGFEAAAVGDLDGDGREDLVLVSSLTTQVVFTVTSPGGVLTLNAPTINGGPAWQGTFGWERPNSWVLDLVVADVKGAQGSGPPDGIPDIVAVRTDGYSVNQPLGDYFPGRVLVAVNTGNGTAFVDASPPGLPLQSLTPGDCNAMSVSVLDVDGQNGPDLFVGVTGTSTTTGTVPGQNRLFLNQPVGWTEALGAFPNSNPSLGVSVLESRPIDFNGDAIPDFAIVTGSDTRVLVAWGR